MKRELSILCSQCGTVRVVKCSKKSIDSGSVPTECYSCNYDLYDDIIEELSKYKSYEPDFIDHSFEDARQRQFEESFIENYD